MKSFTNFVICVLFIVSINSSLQASNRKFINPNQKKQFNLQIQQNFSNRTVWKRYKQSYGNNWSVFNG